MSFAEKEYQFATLKVLGFKYKQIKKIFIKHITFIISAVGTFAVVCIVNQFLARKIKKIDIVSSLKGNE